MSRAKIRGGLAARLVAHHIRDIVDQVTDAAVREIRDQAPEAKTWVTDGSENVRESHAEAHGQTIPGNLPYRLPKQVYVPRGRGQDGRAVTPSGGWRTVSGWDLAQAPRDESLPIHQSINCRCQSVPLPGAVAAAVTRTAVTTTRKAARAYVHVTFPRVAESEFAVQGGGWLRRAALAVASRHR